MTLFDFEQVKIVEAGGKEISEPALRQSLVCQAQSDSWWKKI